MHTGGQDSTNSDMLWWCIMVTREVNSFFEEYVENMIGRLPRLITPTILNCHGICGAPATGSADEHGPLQQ